MPVGLSDFGGIFQPKLWNYCIPKIQVVLRGKRKFLGITNILGLIFLGSGVFQGEMGAPGARGDKGEKVGIGFFQADPLNPEFPVLRGSGKGKEIGNVLMQRESNKKLGLAHSQIYL